MMFKEADVVALSGLGDRLGFDHQNGGGFT